MLLKISLRKFIRIGAGSLLGIFCLLLYVINILVFWGTVPLVRPDSDSLPPGVYVRKLSSTINYGDNVLFTPPKALQRALGEIAQRPVHDLLKQVTGRPLDRVCWTRWTATVFRHPAGPVYYYPLAAPELLFAPLAGRCQRLAANEYFVVGTHPASLDSRYWGLVLRDDIFAPYYAKPFLSL